MNGDMPELVQSKLLGSGRCVGDEMSAPTSSASGTAKRVLLADPCEDVVDSTAALFQLWGHDVRTALSGLETLEAAREYRPDAILMEIALPGLDGFSVARRLREMRMDSGLLLVAVTGYGDVVNRRRSQEAGFDMHLLKPVEPEALRRLLIRQTKGRSSRREI
jgi:CheY-like chemotaxis protein